MADAVGEGEAAVTVARPLATEAPSGPPSPLAPSASFKEGRSARRGRGGAARRPSMEADEFINLLHGSDPVRVELTRLENEVRGLEMVFDSVVVLGCCLLGLGF